MKRFSRLLLPLLTLLSVACAILVPPKVSLLLDRQLIGSVHTEALVGDGNFTLPSTTMAQRVRMLAALEDRSSPADYTYTTLALTQAEHDEACELARQELKALQEAGWLSTLLPLEELDLSCYRFHIRQAEDNLGGSFLHVDINCIPLKFSAEMVLDESTGMALWLELFSAHSDVFRSHPIAQRFSPFGGWFLDRLGLEGSSLDTGNSVYEVYTLPDAQVAYRMIHHDFMISFMCHPNEGE